MGLSRSLAVWLGSGTGLTPRVLSIIGLLMVAGVLALLVLALAQGKFLIGARFFTLGLLAAVVAGGIGAVVGMIFALPETAGRVQVSAADAAEGKAAQRESTDWFLDNSSLERIATWLTGAIIALSLANFTEWLGRFADAAARLDQAMWPTLGTGGVWGALLLGSYGVLGFIGSYLWTRRYLPAELANARKELRDVQRADDAAARATAAAADVSGNVAITRVSNATNLATEAVESAESIVRKATEGAVRGESLRPAREFIRPGPVPDDPWKGQFGRRSEMDGVSLSATVRPNPTMPGTFSIELLLREGLPPPVPRLAGSTVRVYLHPSFGRPIAEYGVDANGMLRLPLVAWGAFTVGVQRLDNGDLLELDLATIPDAPADFRSR